jgi:hypothetical protein
MSQYMSAPAEQRCVKSASGSDNPPEERFWQRYSKHHELPISTAGSVLLHGVVVGAVILVAVAAFAATTAPPLPLGVVQEIGGGDGNPGPSENAARTGIQPGSSEEVAHLQSQQAATPRQEPNPGLPQPRPDGVRLQISSASRALDQHVNAFHELGKQSRDLRQKLLEQLSQEPGSRGSSDDGRGPDKGPRAGGGPGPGGASISNRQKRLLRWTLIFNTATGDDYRRQLSALGAILAVPQPQGSYLVIRDLKQTPARGKIEDLSAINRIFWIDDKPESVAALASVLGIGPAPTRLIAFFPKSLEDELLRKELSFRGRTEDRIQDTRFEVRSEHGKYVPVVTEQSSN